MDLKNLDPANFIRDAESFRIFLYVSGMITKNENTKIRIRIARKVVKWRAMAKKAGGHRFSTAGLFRRNLPGKGKGQTRKR